MVRDTGRWPRAWKPGPCPGLDASPLTRACAVSNPLVLAEAPIVSRPCNCGGGGEPWAPAPSSRHGGSTPRWAELGCPFGRGDRSREKGFAAGVGLQPGVSPMLWQQPGDSIVPNLGLHLRTVLSQPGWSRAGSTPPPPPSLSAPLLRPLPLPQKCPFSTPSRSGPQFLLRTSWPPAPVIPVSLHL